ncbi:MAG TPA: hypothetical protein ENF95_00930 [Candidatus Aenigmarchaeota archaeon]|nr:hypothetical protein [Candidatus Aenigmarchaeota archaeon]
MVRIERLSMQGFKSFANKTSLPFPSGFNVICGANGSGKSNIVDALCFVLGIRSTKTIRAERLEQLIFNGGKNRPSAKYGEVNLYLNNEDGAIPGEGPLIKITRKVNKNGVSIYKLNGKTVNRRKIVDILANAGIYADGHNIIMQGDVTNLIEMTPLQRKEIIDEVSGIAEFEDKKTKAENELAKVDAKLKEAQIILSEREKTLKKLEREQQLAREYKTLEEQLRIISGSIIHKKLTIARERLKEVEEELERVEREFKEIESEFQEYDRKLEERQKEMREITTKVFKKSKNTEAYHKLNSEIDKLKTKLESNIREIQRIEDLLRRLSVEDRLSELLKKKTGVYGTVGELFTTDPKYQSAIEVAAGNHLNDFIVKSDEVAENCILFLKKEKLGRATFLPLNKIRYKEEKLEDKIPGVIDFAINLIDFDPAFEPAMKYVFATTLVVEDLPTARKLIGKYRIVTLDGDLIQKSGAMTGGFREKSKLQELSKYRNQKRELEEENERIRDEIAVLEGKINKLKEEESREILSSGYEEQLNKISDEIEKVRKERQKLYEKRLVAQSKVGNLRIKKAKLEAEIENLEMEFEEYKDLERFVDEDLESMQREKRAIVEKLRRIGSVNMKAIEDYENMKILYEDLKKKVEKIEEEKKAILETVEKIEARRREVFMKTFNEINKHFQELFREIGEGEASLELEDPNDIRSGLIIKARPKGKKMLSIDSMSGGEKTLTALAFLFAVQMYKPAPFYVLDEVDAALDKVNSKKIGMLIKKQSKKAQFIVITHNDVTIKMADQVYGVSMEDGVSKVIAIKLPEN